MQEQIILKSHLQIKNLFALKQETISLIICPADLKASDKKLSYLHDTWWKSHILKEIKNLRPHYQFPRHTATMISISILVFSIMVNVNRFFEYRAEVGVATVIITLVFSIIYLYSESGHY